MACQTGHRLPSSARFLNVNASDSCTLSSSQNAQAIFDSLAGWDDVERALSLSPNERRRIASGFTGGALKRNEAFLVRAMRHPRAFFRVVAAELGDHHASVVELGFDDRYWRVRLIAANSKLAPPERLAQLVYDTSPEVRNAVAGHPQTPLAALHKLLEDKIVAVRRKAAQHDSLLESDLRRLAKHSDWEIRRSMAWRSATPVDVVDRLAQDRHLAVAEAVACNEHASSDALHHVARRTHNFWTFKSIAAHANTRLDDLLYLIDTGNPYALMAIAKTSAEPDALHRLATSDDAVLRAALLTNAVLSSESLAVIPLTASVDQHRDVVRHPNATWDTCRRLAEHYLASKHHGRRQVGVEMVCKGLTKPGAPIQSSTGSLAGPVEVLVALHAGQRRDELAAWAQGSQGLAWLRTYVGNRLKP